MGNDKTDWTVLAVIILIFGGIGGYMIKNVAVSADLITGKTAAQEESDAKRRTIGRTIGGSAVTKRHKRNKNKSHKKALK